MMPAEPDRMQVLHFQEDLAAKYEVAHWVIESLRKRGAAQVVVSTAGIVTHQISRSAGANAGKMPGNVALPFRWAPRNHTKGPHAACARQPVSVYANQQRPGNTAPISELCDWIATWSPDRRDRKWQQLVMD